MNYLEKIVADKRAEILEGVDCVKRREMEMMAASSPAPTRSLSRSIRERSGIIAEFKRQSPSKGVIHRGEISPRDVVGGYEEAGVSAISCLTNVHFAGSVEDLREAVGTVREIPVLRKEFVVDEYQIYEARALGASAVLLIASALEREEAERMAKTAKSLGLEVLMEVHSEREIEEYGETEGVTAVGINNRNLKTFEVDLEHSIRMARMLPSETVKIAESGIKGVEDMVMLRREGFDGFLIGETFMKEENPGEACRRLSEKYKEVWQAELK